MPVALTSQAPAYMTVQPVRAPCADVPGAELATRSTMRALGVLLLLSLLSSKLAAAQVQDLGHRVPSGNGIDAGSQVDEGLYLGDRFVWFSSSEVRDRHGDEIPIANLDIDSYANAFGVAGTKRIGAWYASVAFSVPVVKYSVNSDRPEASVDRLGLGDVFVEPLKLGSRLRHVDVVSSYSVNVPIRRGARGGVGNPQWSHQLAAGGTVFFDERRGWRVSALASYVHHQTKEEIDITRGNTVLVQGGFGGPVHAVIDLGVAGYALWQVTDDSGPDLPPELRGARTRGFGLGPELTIRLRSLRSRLNGRLTWDLDGKARPVGTIVVLALSVVAWR